MARVKNLAEFTNKLNELAAEVPKRHAALQAELTNHAYEFLVDYSPVWSGAYVNEHAIDANGARIYESPDRPGPDIELEYGSLERPDTSEVEPSLSAIEPFSFVEISNDRFYADQVESKHQVYELIYDAIEQEAGGQVLTLGGDVVDRGEDIPF